MASVEERLTVVEAEQMTQQVIVDGIREGLASLRSDMNLRFDRLDDRMSRQFLWLVGTQMMMLVALVTALAAIVSGLALR